MRMKATLITLAACAAVTVTACGGDDSSTTAAEGTSTTAAISKDDFIQQAQAICKAGNKDINAAAKETFGASKDKPTSDELTSFATDALIPSVQSQIDQIRALGIPEGDETVVNQGLDDAQAGVDALSDDPLSVGSGTPVLDKGAKELSDYGVTACGN